MVAGAADCLHQGIPVIDVPYRCIAKEIEEIVDMTAAPASAAVAAASSSPVLRQAERGSEVVTLAVDITVSEMEAVSAAVDITVSEMNSGASHDISTVEPLRFIPNIRSGSFADIGPRKFMEDEHICIDDLSTHLGSPFRYPTPSAFYGVFDGHGGLDAAAYIKQHAIRFLFEDANFPQATEADEIFVESVENSVRESFLHADLALADDSSISSSSGTTALAALVFGRYLLVANAGDCRAVLCRKGEAIDMSQDHRPIHDAERKRVEQSGGFIEDGYLNGALSVTRALGDWSLKMPRGSPSPLIAEPEFRQAILTEDDEFLIIGCDGIWEVMSSQLAVGIVRSGLRRHNDPGRCARELVMKALSLNPFDNLTVIVICFCKEYLPASPPKGSRWRPTLKGCKILSAEALITLRNSMNNSGNN